MFNLLLQFAEKILIKNGNIFDGIQTLIQTNKVIEIENGAITYIGNERRTKDKVKTIDAKGKFVMPGIIDCHMHLGGILGSGILDRILEPNMQQAMLAVQQAIKTVQHGVTTVCDVSMAGPYLKRLIDAGEIIGPSLIPSGQGFAMGGGGPYADPDGLFSNSFIRENHPWADPCDGVDNLRHGVRMRLKIGCTAIKIWATGGGLQERKNDLDRAYTDEELSAVCSEAKMAGIPVVAHCESIEGTKAAIRCGVGGILHGLELDDNCIRLFLEKDAWFMPTLKCNLDWACTDEELQHREGLHAFEGQTLQEKERNRIQYIVRYAHNKGVKIALASDTYCNEATPYGEFTLDEIKTLVNKGGLNVYEALFASTKNAAEALGIDDMVGTIEKGKMADILILSKDIIGNIDLLTKENIEMVIKCGKRIV
jgi:imidazolonepropionase-like amidohydrolase